MLSSAPPDRTSRNEPAPFWAGSESTAVIHTGPPRIAWLAFWAFVIGGLLSVGIFMVNSRSLLMRPNVTVDVPLAGAIPLGSLPLLPAGAGSSSSAPGADGSVAAAPPSSGLAALARNLLPEWPSKDRLNILLLGIDKRDGESADGTRSDTMILASIDPVTKAAALVSLPRDMWVNIPGYGPQRINVAHAVGGPDLAMQTVTADFGIPIQYYVRIDFRGFVQVVDAVGGVLVDVQRPVNDNAYPTTDYGYGRIYVGPGPQLLDGENALYFARSRHSENDFGRAARQQQVVLAVRDRALRLNMLPKAPEMLGIVQKSITTNLAPVQLLQLARLGSELDRSKILNLVLDTNYVTPFVGSDGADLLQPNYPAIRAAIDRTIKAANRPELRASIAVLNGTSRPGLGQIAADYLTAQGFNVVKIAVADRTDYASSSLEVLTGNTDAGAAIAKLLNVPAESVRDLPSATGSADIRLILGQDFVVPRP